MRKPIVANKYNLTPYLIHHLIPDRSALPNNSFWRDEKIRAWCFSEGTARTNLETKSENRYTILVYDENSPTCSGKIRLIIEQNGGMKPYRLRQFLRPKDVLLEQDLRVQEMLLQTLNRLLDYGVLRLPNKD